MATRSSSACVALNSMRFMKSSFSRALCKAKHGRGRKKNGGAINQLSRTSARPGGGSLVEQADRPGTRSTGDIPRGAINARAEKPGYCLVIRGFRNMLFQAVPAETANYPCQAIRPF